jgi:hypothetical protein
MQPMTLNQLLLPKCPDPACVHCKQRMGDREVRPYRADWANKRLVLVHCLSVCAGCGHRHIGVRALAPLGKALRYVHQSFEAYTPARYAELAQVCAYLQGDEAPLDLGTDAPWPESAQVFVWFENTLAAPERVAPARPAPGLPEAVLPRSTGVTVLERRAAPGSAEHLSGVLVQSHSVEILLDWLNALRALARCHGTLAWSRRYDVREYAVAWDTFTPAPGNSYVSESRLPEARHEPA